MANKMLIDATHPEETRVVVVRGNRVEEFDFESASRRQLRGNIYLAKVTRVEPSLQAAFVEYGGNRHGFLAFSEIHPDYYQIPVADRQALIEEEERAHRDAEAEVERRAGRGRRSHAARSRSRVQRSEPIEGEERPTADPEFTELDAEADTEAAADRLISGASGAEAPADGALEAPVESDTSDNMQGLPASAADQNDHLQDADSASPGPSEPTESDQPMAHSMAGDAAVASETTAPADAPEGERADDSEEPDAREIEDVDADDEEVVESVGGADALEEVQERVPRYRRQYKIQEVIKRRQVMLVRVVKEERGTKGAALTTYLSLAGRYSVLMPNTARGGGISRKITSAEDRNRLKQIAQELEVPEGMGVILRTAGANRTKAEVKRDFEYLLRLWETVRDLTLKSTAPKLVYEEGSLIKRAIRDLYNKDIDEVVVGGEDGYREAKDFMRMLMPSHAKNVKLYKDTQPVFTRYSVESQLDAMFSPVVQLRSGGYIVINQAEALVAIDVNSGRATREHHIEDTALKTNLEAAEEIARQLRLRDLAGLIVIDFIDMDEKRNNRAVERKLKECLKHDRARIQVGRISHFGLLEMSRQRIRTGVLESSTEKCAHCGGAGHVRSVSSVTLQLLRSLEEGLLKGATHNMIVRTRTEIALYVLNHKRGHLRDLENRFRITIAINADATINGQQPFVIERGEQVHSIEAARAIAMQPEPAPALIGEEDEEAEVAAEETQIDAENGEADENGGRKRRRRRRRGRRGESGEQAEGTPRVHASPSSETDEDESDEPGEQSDEEDVSVDAANGLSEAERRRRRRGRRGGRRNRRDREDGRERDAEPRASASASPPAEGWQEWAAGSQADAVEPPAPPQPRSSPTAEIPPGAASEPAPPQMQALEPEAAASAQAARKRSTVREPAPGVTPVLVESASAPPPTPSSAASASVPEEEADQGDRPRRTGWWAKRMFGRG
ncbi:MAG TPA: Rne/Rng family ribonuclease [Xanthobacteraceae bacterium]|nr:Rne/Rng family ribonuclease [Xanthobacteraceae bacterium]